MRRNGWRRPSARRPSIRDYRDLLARDDIQSVDVCLHNHLHAPVTIATLEAGKNVYCEKPMSWNYSAAKSMLAAAKRTGRLLHIQLATIYAAEARQPSA